MSRPLRIFLCCQQSQRRHAVPAYAFWAEYFRHACAEAGHTCLEARACDWAEGLLPADMRPHPDWADRTWSSALTCLRQEHAREPIDFFLGYLFPAQVLPGAVADIRALGIPCVNFFCDNVREFRRVPAAFRDFDLHWVPRAQGTAALHARPPPCSARPGWPAGVSFREYYRGQPLFHEIVAHLGERGFGLQALGPQTPLGAPIGQTDALFLRFP